MTLNLNAVPDYALPWLEDMTEKARKKDAV
jgi:hypothetical protein